MLRYTSRWISRGALLWLYTRAAFPPDLGARLLLRETGSILIALDAGIEIPPETISEIDRNRGVQIYS